MRNSNTWRPSKVVRKCDRFEPSCDSLGLSVSSRVMAKVQLLSYEKVIKKHAGGVLLDLGCGNVPYYEIYRDQVIENVCVDWEQTAHANCHLDHTADLNRPLKFPDDSFDTVLLTDVLEHISNPFQLVGEISRVLKSGGKLILGVPFFYWVHEAPHDHYRFTQFALRSMCESSRLTVVDLSAYGGVPEIFADLTSKCLAAVLPDFVLRVYVNICKAIVLTRLSQSFSARTQDQFPLGYVVVAEKS
jgi:SAM-dependent methyltransferase